MVNWSNARKTCPPLLPACSALALACAILNQTSAIAQETSDGAANHSTTSGAPVLNVTRGNPLEGLFTPQPQFPTAQTLANPQPPPPAPGELNPLKGLFTPQPQYMTPQAIPNPEGRPADGEVNHLKSVFTPNNQFVTPQTSINPQPAPRALVPERQYLWGSDEEKTNLIKQHNFATFGSEAPPLAVPPAPQQKGIVKGKEPGKEPGNGTAQAKEQGNDLAASQSGLSTEAKGSAAAGKAVEPAAPEHASRSMTMSASDKSAPSPLREGTSPLREGPSPLREGPSPLREALSSMRVAKYDQSLQILDRVISEKPNDAEAHYLKAVALVNLHRYPEATTEYRQVVHLCQQERLGGMALEGLKKIGATP